MRILLTAAIAIYVAASICGLLVLATILPGLWAFLVLPAGIVNGLVVGDMLHETWRTEGQYDDGECV